MKCPLSQMTTYPELRETRFRWADCLKEECAWWEEREGRCAILALAQEMVVIKSKVYEIVAKLPSRERLV